MDDDLDLAATHGLRHMSLPAAATSGLMHALAALAVLWSLPVRPVETNERAIDITIEQATPPPAAQPVEAPPLPTLEQLLPPPDLPPALDAAAAFPPPPSLPQEGLQPAPLPETREARLEDALPPVDEPPPFSTRELASRVPAPAIARPAAPAAPARRPAPPPAVQREPVRQASTARLENERRAQEDYLLQIIQKLSRYRYYPTSHEASESGMVVTRVTVARDGRLLDVELARSSGYPTLDRGVMDTIRRAAPFASLPAELADSQMSFIVPISYNRER